MAPSGRFADRTLASPERRPRPAGGPPDEAPRQRPGLLQRNSASPERRHTDSRHVCRSGPIKLIITRAPITQKSSTEQMVRTASALQAHGVASSHATVEAISERCRSVSHPALPLKPTPIFSTRDWRRGRHSQRLAGAAGDLISAAGGHVRRGCQASPLRGGGLHQPAAELGSRLWPPPTRPCVALSSGRSGS